MDSVTPERAAVPEVAKVPAARGRTAVPEDGCRRRGGQRPVPGRRATVLVAWSRIAAATSRITLRLVERAAVPEVAKVPVAGGRMVSARYGQGPLQPRSATAKVYHSEG